MAGTFGAAASANTLNQIYEVVNDARMKRTMMRPLPLGRISRLQALVFAGLMGVGGTAILTEKVRSQAQLLLQFAHNYQVSTLSGQNSGIGGNTNCTDGLPIVLMFHSPCC